MAAYIFDTESTGFKEAKIIEAAWIKLCGMALLTATEHFCQRYNPGKPSDMGALAVHHILDEELVACPPSEEFRLPPDAIYLIGHNVDFDWQLAGKPDVKRICTHALCRMLWPQVDSHSQSAMLYFLHDNKKAVREMLKTAHSAYQDVLNCHLLLGYVIDALTAQGHIVERWEDLWLHSERARIPTVMPFGKHQGMAMADVPRDYKDWLLRQPDVDPYLRQALEAA